MKEEEHKELDEMIDKMPDSFWGRLWDDDCICEDSITVNPNCPNKRCIELK